MRHIARLVPVVLLAFFAVILFSHRGLFFSKFDEPYWKDKFEHSQWKLPLSQRTLGDDGLYLYEGYRLIHGADPSLLNAEVPPLGKYLIGASVVLFNNGHIYGLLIYLVSLLLFFLLAVRLFPPTIAIALAGLFALDPLLTRQAALTMLDGLQMVFLLLFFLLLRKRAHAILLGAALGLFAETKFGVLAPALAVIGAIYLRNWHGIFFFFASAAAAYLLPYIQYFLLGHSLVDWLQTQKWIVWFYAHNNLTPTFGSSLVALLVGYTQNIYSRAWQPISEWSPVWSVVTIATIAAIRKIWRPAAVFVAAVFAFYLILPFWTRYLLLLLPFLYLGFGWFLEKVPKKIAPLLLAVLLSLNAVASLRVLFPTPETAVRQFVYEWEHGFFQDMYESITIDKRDKLTRDEFRRIGLTAYHEAEIESVQVSLGTTRWSHASSAQSIPFTATYRTRNLGEFTHAGSLPVIREEGRWRVDWDWELLFEDFAPGRAFVTTIVPGRRGSIVGGDKQAVSYDFPSLRIQIVPGEVDPAREEAMLSFIEDLFAKNVTAVAFHQRYVGNSLPDLPIAVAILGTPPTAEERSKLLSFPGVQLVPAPGRFQGKSNLTNVGFVANTAYGECCSSLYSTTNYDGFEGLEKEFNPTLKGTNGGTLTLTDPDGSVVRTIIQREKQDGRDVDLLSTFKTP